MARGKKELDSAVRASIVLEKAQWEHVKKIAIQMSVEKGRLVTPTEALRLAINNYYPLDEKLELLAPKS
jgi:predicted DNA-binding ribbon-helix-helix protein